MSEQKFLLQLLQLQRELIDEFARAYPTLPKSDWLIGYPTRGELHLSDSAWEFAKHGSGLTFTRSNPAPHLVVDMHKEVWNSDAVDAWRLQQFVESAGGTISHQDAKVFLETAGDMRTERDGYQGQG